VTPPYIANRRIIFDLPRVYPELRKALRAGLAPDSVQVLQTVYPNPLMDQGHRFENGVWRGPEFCTGPNDNRLFSAMHGMFPDAKVDPANRWRLQIDASEGREILDSLLDPLNAAVEDNARQGGRWAVVQLGTAFDDRGWCAGDLTERKDYGFPALGFVDGSSARKQTWIPFNPAQWDAYKPATRLFRTANDVVLTQIGSARPLFAPIPSLANASFFSTSGMFHPTAQAHTIIGMSIAVRMLNVLPAQ